MKYIFSFFIKLDAGCYLGPFYLWFLISPFVVQKRRKGIWHSKSNEGVKVVFTGNINGFIKNKYLIFYIFFPPYFLFRSMKDLLCNAKVQWMVKVLNETTDANKEPLFLVKIINSLASVVCMPHYMLHQNKQINTLHVSQNLSSCNVLWIHQY